MNITNTALDQTTRAQYATLIDYANGAGQTPGTGLGELPAGYAPLDTAQVAQSQQLSDILTGKLDPNPGSDDSTSGYTPPTVNVPGDSSAGGSGGVQTITDNTSSDSSEAGGLSGPKQPASSTQAGGWALGGSLLAGLLSAVAAPLLMRRKKVGP